MEKKPQQAEWSFRHISSMPPYKTQMNKPVTPMSNFDLEMLWQEAKDLDSQKSDQKITKNVLNVLGC